MNVQQLFDAGEGILRMAPNWVPRSFCIPGQRLRLDPRDLYALGIHRGGIDERWFASTVKAENGPHTGEWEGLSFVTAQAGQEAELVLFSTVIAEMGANLVGQPLWETYHGWPVFAKFFDNRDALPFHLHQRQEHAEMVGKRTKPEAYYFPAQMNASRGTFPLSFFGLEAGTTREDIKRCLANWHHGDNGILYYSRAFLLELGTGWDIPAGTLHAPGSLCTYEPQWASDISALFQSVVNDTPFGWEALTSNVPEEYRHDLDFIVSMIDWELNTDPAFRAHHQLKPQPILSVEDSKAAGYQENHIIYGNGLFRSTELIVQPGRSITLQGDEPYSAVIVQGHGKMGVWQIEAPDMIRFGQLTDDEFFISSAAARQGVRIENTSQSEPLVMLKTYGPPT